MRIYIYIKTFFFFNLKASSFLYSTDYKDGNFPFCNRVSVLFGPSTILAMA